MSGKYLNPNMTVRMPQALKDQLKQHAIANNRTLNAEIVFALQQYNKQQQLALEKTT